MNTGINPNTGQPVSEIEKWQSWSAILGSVALAAISIYGSYKAFKGMGAAKLNKLKPNEINNMSLDELRKSIPDDWQIFEHNGRIHIKDASGNFRVKIDPPDRVTNYKHMHIFDSEYNPLDINGNIVDRKSSDAHIPWVDK